MNSCFSMNTRVDVYQSLKLSCTIFISIFIYILLYKQMGLEILVYQLVNID